ncbi:hypothetical protein MNBD_GAMMA25-827 [hydrothermal vent metagenome]|uniref:Uncharacterized protein n=1 Tax=hydrothermal vent metagenome TaxID=652676 RepID=A0A3B1ARI9_9ZZZZ
MIQTLKWYQKLIAYSALFMVFLWTLFGVFTIWLYLSEYFSG